MTGNPDIPPFTVDVDTTSQALRSINAVRQGVIPRMTRRFNYLEHRTVKYGTVFVSTAKQSGIKRLTDGLLWLPSRLVGDFLVYHEINKRTSRRGNHKKPYPGDESSRALVRMNSTEHPPCGLEGHYGGDQGDFKAGGLIHEMSPVASMPCDVCVLSYGFSDGTCSLCNRTPTGDISSESQVPKLESFVKVSFPSSTPPTKPVFDNKLNLFAVIVAIDNYVSRDFPLLRGAVADATNILDLLVSNYQVPKDHIRFLTNKDASRSAIIAALDGLSRNPSIRPGDPILFYFAGHGSEIDPPEGWESGGPKSKIQVLVPHDYCSSAGHEIPGIPDRTIGFLLDKIAHNKGNNITVIFDCCHAASGTRGDPVRSVEVDSSIHTNALDTGIRDERTPQFGLASHILLAACRPSEVARENNGQGVFTAELLRLLRKISPDKLRYRDVLHKMRPIDSQNPQCEGLHQDRYLFTAQVSSPAPVSYVVQYDPASSAIFINVGVAHGVTDGAEFAIHVAQEPDPHGKPLGIYVIDKATDFSSIMKPAGDFTISVSPFPLGLVAFQTKPGQGNALRLYVREPREPLALPSHRDLIIQACGQDLHSVQFVDSQDEAHLQLTVHENRVVITVRDIKSTQHGRYCLPTTKITWDELGPFLSKSQFCYHERDRSSSDIDMIKDISVEFYRLEEMPSSFKDISEPQLAPSTSNLCYDGIIHLVVEDGHSYGVKITNNGPYDLYPCLFYFDSSDPTRIRTYYQLPSSGPYSLEPPLKGNGGTLAIGYGSGGMPPFSYPLLGHVNVGFLKLFVSTRPLNSTFVAESCICSSSSRYCGRALTDTWGTITIPMIQRPSRSRR